MLRVFPRSDAKVLVMVQRLNNLQCRLERAIREDANPAFVSTLENEVENTRAMIHGPKWTF